MKVNIFEYNLLAFSFVCINDHLGAFSGTNVTQHSEFNAHKNTKRRNSVTNVPLQIM